MKGIWGLSKSPLSPFLLSQLWEAPAHGSLQNESICPCNCLHPCCEHPSHALPGGCSVPPYLSAWAWFTPRDHRSFLLKLVFERAQLTQREEQDRQRFISGGSINQPMAGVGLCQTFPWGKRRQPQGMFLRA